MQYYELRCRGDLYLGELFTYVDDFWDDDDEEAIPLFVPQNGLKRVCRSSPIDAKRFLTYWIANHRFG